MSAPAFLLYDIERERDVDTFPSREAAEGTAEARGIRRFVVYQGHQAEDSHGRPIFVAERTVAWRDAVMSAA
jgi:hypothetical protein